SPGRGIRFRESMPRPLLIGFIVAAIAAAGLVVWLLISPPAPRALDLGSRRSPPLGSFTHFVVRADPAPIPTPIPTFTAPCDAVAGVVVEGGGAAQNRIGFVLKAHLCRIFSDEFQPAEVKEAIAALSRARIRFAVFARTGEQSTTDLAANRILLNVDLARTSVDPIVIAPLLVHEGWHLTQPVTAFSEYEARIVELQACSAVFETVDDFSRGCRDAQAIVALGKMRAIESLVRAGYPR
ncbi:MAG: hypothetical protein ACRDKS_08650, partial [Actinomycetota bacterium]